MRLQPQPVVNEFFAYEKNSILIISQHKQRKIKKKARYMFLEFCTLTSLSHPYVYISFLFFVKFLSHFF